MSSYSLEQCFLASLLEKPYDPATCAAYSDWLEEQDRPSEASWQRYTARRQPTPSVSNSGKTHYWWLAKGQDEPSFLCKVEYYLWHGLSAYRTGRYQYWRPTYRQRREGETDPTVWTALTLRAGYYSKDEALRDLKQAFLSWWQKSHGFVQGERIWAGDEWCDKVAGCPSVYDIWQQKFGQPLDIKKALHVEDEGDCFVHYFDNGYCVSFCCDGNYIHRIACRW